MSDELTTLARSLDEVVRAVPGVVTLFAADPVLLRSTKQIATRDADLPLIRISRSGDSVEITVSVGVSGENQAPETAAAVAAAVTASLPWADAAVHVRVSRISTQ